MEATRTLPAPDPVLDAEDRILAGSGLTTAREELVDAMKHLDTTETRGAHRCAGLAVSLIDDALTSLAQVSE